MYERGWRQNFARYGFPGPDEEVSVQLPVFGQCAVAAEVVT